MARVRGDVFLSKTGCKHKNETNGIISNGERNNPILIAEYVVTRREWAISI